jgi:formimidoylglutamate deiminase
LITRTRNVAAIRRPQTGRSLFELSLEGGAKACGHASAGLKKGAFADLITLDDDNPMLTGHGKESILDALVFSGFTLPIDRVMVNGRWVVNGGRHAIRDDARTNYAAAIEGIKAELDLAS